MSFYNTTKDDLESFSEVDPYIILKGYDNLSIVDVEELEVEILKVLSFKDSDGQDLFKRTTQNNLYLSHYCNS